jgi:TusA-related sulfurtransferase
MERIDRALDTIGLVCPLPIIKMMESLSGMDTGEVLEVVSDEPGIENDARSVCERTGDRFLDVREEGGLFRVYIERSRNR